MTHPTLPDDYARCNASDQHGKSCKKRHNCLRYIAQPTTKYAWYIRPTDVEHCKSYLPYKSEE